MRTIASSSPWTPAQVFTSAMFVALIGMIFVVNLNIHFYMLLLDGAFVGDTVASGASAANAKASWRVMPKAAISSDGLVLPTNHSGTSLLCSCAWPA